MPKAHKATAIQIRKMIRLKRKGLTLREIATITGFSQEGVRYILSKFELKNDKKQR